MSENCKRHKPLKGLFGSIPKPSVKDPNNPKPGAYYKQNQTQCIKHIVARLNARLSHWDTGALEQMVLSDMSLERLAQREYRFFFMQDASIRTRKYAPFAPPTEDEIQVWEREFHKAGNECQRIVRARFGILQAYKIPMIELWDYERLVSSGAGVARARAAAVKGPGRRKDRWLIATAALSATVVFTIGEETLGPLM
ncbi:hypothetical protein ATEIFO6365_0009040800 [Aspergillus terreus]|uniref:Uncharacterized protein n=1 Tax=Aspergillus terreus TaxID=33178 RepID=A0A5M3Z898_ASPTE|nr:hypothetical protein ATETN484_0011040300 [Aspergillus terreus]GFF19045.1 hypothetical protein ATEIFO6365_0009040800 [Aspergillus terreus]